MNPGGPGDPSSQQADENRWCSEDSHGRTDGWPSLVRPLPPETDWEGRRPCADITAKTASQVCAGTGHQAKHPMPLLPRRPLASPQGTTVSLGGLACPCGWYPLALCLFPIKPGQHTFLTGRDYHFVMHGAGEGGWRIKPQRTKMCFHSTGETNLDLS